jgi:hypothetical protein
LNPSFRVFEIDSNSKIPKDYLQYRLNITQANLNAETPKFEISYRASELFNVKYLNDTQGINKYTLDIESDDKVFRKALKAFYSDGPNYDEYLKVKSRI